EYALLNKEAHAAVHSMKDVPFELPKDFELVAIPERDDIRDVFVSSNGVHFEDLKEGAIIGTSSIRRAAMLRELRKDLNIVPIRGNVQTRLERMKKENMDGIILAAAGIKRLNLEDIITDYFDPKIFLPAIGQGALGIEALKDGEYNMYLKGLDNKEVRTSVEAERSFMRRLNGGCHSVIGVYSEIKGNDLYMIGTFDLGGKIVKKDILGNKDTNIELGLKLAEKILKG
ncbi:hydroxymethylbilane synthase, partial [Clostridium perfringens]